MSFDELCQSIVNLTPHFVGGNDSQLILGNRDREIHLATVTDVDS